MKNRIVKVLAGAALSVALMAGCGSEEAASTAPETKETTEAKEEPAEEETKTEETGAEFTFADLQDSYKSLVESYDAVEGLYADDAIAQDDEVESLLAEAKGIIDDMGEMTEDDFSSTDDMIAFNDTIATMIEALGGVVDKMQAAGDSEGVETEDVIFVDGFYATDGSAEFALAFYETSDGDVAYITDGEEEVFAEYTVEPAETDGGDEYLLVTVGNLSLGYIEDGDDIYLIDEDGNIYGAARLTEEEAAQLVADAQ
ncbi:MAG: hypothetical protein IKR23_05210 [Lachnospiraceae bacterium]|nr:hypothetical protein [Lachnospiraceae bacterium]